MLKELDSLNTVRKYKQLLHLSDIVCYDGKTVDHGILTREPGLESSHGSQQNGMLLQITVCGIMPSVSSHLQLISGLKHWVPS